MQKNETTINYWEISHDIVSNDLPVILPYEAIKNIELCEPDETLIEEYRGRVNTLLEAALEFTEVDDPYECVAKLLSKEPPEILQVYAHRTYRLVEANLFFQANPKHIAFPEDCRIGLKRLCMRSWLELPL